MDQNGYVDITWDSLHCHPTCWAMLAREIPKANGYFWGLGLAMGILHEYHVVLGKLNIIKL